MKKLLSLLLVLALCLGAVGCGRNSENYNYSTEPSKTTISPVQIQALHIVNYFADKGLPIGNVKDYSETTDPNEIMGVKEDAYISKSNFEDVRTIPAYTDIKADYYVPPNTVEVFKNAEDAQARYDYFSSSSLNASYNYLYCNVLLRLNDTLTKAESEEYEKLFFAACTSPSSLEKLPEVLTAILRPSSDEAVTAIIRPEYATDYFSDLDRQAQYSEWYKTYQFDKIYNSVNEYMASAETASYDSAHAILTELENIVPWPKSYIINFDEFDNTYMISFLGAETIDSTCSFVPTISGTTARIKLGFIKNDWLFFDKYAISIDGEVISSGYCSDSVERNVLGGSNIIEYVITSAKVDKDELLAISTAEKAIIRFTNTDTNEYYDHELTANEKSAASGIYYIYWAYRNLSDLLYHFNN